MTTASLSNAKKIFAASLWLTLSLVIVGAVYFAPAAQDFVGQSYRIVYFHVPMAWASFVAFVAAGIWSVLYLIKGRQLTHDHKAQAGVELGLVFCLLATVTGAMWARTEWGVFWNWDPRQTSIVMALLFYLAYLALRANIEDPATRRRLSAAYAALGLVVAPFLFFVAPRMVKFSLHPQSVINASGKVEMDSRMLLVLLVSTVAFTALFFWMHDIHRRILALREREASPTLRDGSGRAPEGVD